MNLYIAYVIAVPQCGVMALAQATFARPSQILRNVSAVFSAVAGVAIANHNGTRALANVQIDSTLIKQRRMHIRTMMREAGG